jgi:hypothetical protein
MQDKCEGNGKNTKTYYLYLVFKINVKLSNKLEVDGLPLSSDPHKVATVNEGEVKSHMRWISNALIAVAITWGRWNIVTSLMSSPTTCLAMWGFNIK